MRVRERERERWNPKDIKNVKRLNDISKFATHIFEEVSKMLQKNQNWKKFMFGKPK